MAEESIWDGIAGASPTTAGGRWRTPDELPAFTYIERIRKALPESDDSPEATAALTSWHSEHRGTGLRGAWRAPDGTLLSPAWFATRSMAVDPATGNVAAAGALAYETLGIDVPAMSFMSIDGLYIGSLRSGSLLPLDTGLSVSSVDLAPGSGEIAVLHHLANSTFAVSIVAQSGDRRLLAILEGVFGNEPIRYSPDGKWLLVPQTKSSYLIEVATGRSLVLDVGNTGWGPSESTLLTIQHENGTAVPRVFSLRSNGFERDLPAVALDVPLLETFPYLWFPVVSPDGAEVLAGTPAGVSVEYQGTYGVGQHLARFELETGQGSLVTAPFANPEGTLERDVVDSAWPKVAAPAWSLALHADLAAQLRDPVTTPEDPSWLNRERWADEAEIVVVNVMNRAIELVREGSSVAPIMPEIVAALRTIAKSPAWERQSEWLSGLRDITMSMVSSGELDGDASTAWLYYAITIRAIEQGQSDEISAIGLHR